MAMGFPAFPNRKHRYIIHLYTKGWVLPLLSFGTHLLRVFFFSVGVNHDLEW